MMKEASEPDWGSVMAPDDSFLAKAVSEPAIEPDLPIMDAHGHLWHLFDDCPYFVPELARDTAVSGHNVAATVYVECNAFYRATGPDHLKWVGEEKRQLFSETAKRVYRLEI